MLTGFKDAKGREFRVGDLVVNTGFFDIWIVGKYSDSPKTAEYEGDCPFYLCLLNDLDSLYLLDINHARGFLRGECQGCEICDEYKTSFHKKFEGDIDVIKL